MYPLPHLTNYLYMSQTAQPGFTRLIQSSLIKLQTLIVARMRPRL